MKKVLAALASTLALAGAASADVIVDTGSTPNGNSQLIHEALWWAGKFTVTDSYVLTSIEGFMFAYGGFPTGRISLYADGLLPVPPNPVESVPDQLLYTATFEFTAGYLQHAWEGLSGLNWTIGPGSYWVAFEGGSNSIYGLVTGVPNPFTAEYPLEAEAQYQGGYGYWTDQMVYGIHGSLKNPRSIAVRVMGDRVSAGAVPEPGAWAIMLAGFGMAGAVLRRRRIAPFRVTST